MLIGVGASDDTDARVAGGACARDARAQLDGPPGVALAFCGGRHAPRDFLAALRRELGAIPVIGGAVPGAMGPGVGGTRGYESLVILMAEGLAGSMTYRGVDLGSDERDAGRRLAADLAPSLSDAGALLLFYDSVRAAGPRPLLHVGSHLVDGLSTGLAEVSGETGPAIIGAGTLSDFDLGPSYVLDGADVATHAAVALALPARIEVLTTIMHGCMPASDFMEITRSEGATLFELDGRPALHLLSERLGLSPSEIARQATALGLTLGQKLGHPFAPFDERNYVNRLVVHADEDSGALTLFEADYREGARVQLMLTDHDGMSGSAHARTHELLQAIDGPEPLLGFYIDCVGRAPAFCGTELDEAEAVRGLVEARMPWAGIYSGVEIAPVGGRSRPLDWTGVLSIWRLKPGD